VTATLSNGCYSSGTKISKTITLGSPSLTITAIKTSATGEPTTYSFTAPTFAGGTYSWYVTGATNNPQQTGSSNTFDWYFPCNVTKTIYCILTNPCGGATSNSISKTGECIRTNFKVSPNPANSTITVSSLYSKSAKNDSPTFNSIRIYDFAGNLKIYKKFSKEKDANLNISNLQKGNYIIEIVTNTYKEQQQIIIIK